MRIYDRNIGDKGEVLTYKCQFITDSNRQREGEHYQEKHSPAPLPVSARMLLATAAVSDMKLRHIDVEQAFL